MLTLVASRAGAQTTPTWTDPNTGTSYTYITGSFSDNASLLKAQPWWGDASSASNVVENIGSGLGAYPYQWPDQRELYNFGSVAAYSNGDFPSNALRPANATVSTAVKILSVSDSETGGVIVPSPGFSVLGWIDPNVSQMYVVTSSSLQSISAPEIDGSKIPQAAFILATVFLIIRRKNMLLTEKNTAHT